MAPVLSLTVFQKPVHAPRDERAARVLKGGEVSQDRVQGHGRAAVAAARLRVSGALEGMDAVGEERRELVVGGAEGEDFGRRIILPRAVRPQRLFGRSRVKASDLSQGAPRVG